MLQRLLLFDIDGTLMLSRGRGLRAMHLAMQQVFGRTPVPATILPHGKTDLILFDELAGFYEIPGHEVERCMMQLQVVYATHLERLLRDGEALEIKPGVPQLLERLRRNAVQDGTGMGITSGNLERTSWLKLEAAGLSHYFTSGGFGCSARRRDQLVAQALSRFGVRPDDNVPARKIWVIGDTPEDVESGKAFGLRTLAVATGRHSRASLERTGADVVLDDLSGTDAVFELLCG